MQIEFQFDVRTIALFVAITFFVQATAIGAQAFLIRELKQYRGIRAALMANLLVAVGILLRLFLDRWPDFLTIILANILLLASPGLFYIALSRLTGSTYSHTFVIGVLAIIVLILLYFTYGDNDIGRRIVVVSIGAVVMVGLLVYQLLRIRKTSLRFSANLMLIAFIIFGTFLILRTISLVLDPPQTDFDNVPVHSATYLMMFAFSFFWSTGFMLMLSQRLRNDLMEMATTDALTRIPNRRATEAFFEKEFSRAQRNRGRFSVLLIDIDNFKQVNDRWGHSTGDDVLVKTASIFQTMIRKQDWVGRWGGEEFLMILPGDCDVEPLAERVRREVAGSSYYCGTKSFGITISVGVTCATYCDPIGQVLQKADQALYVAKRTKNTVSTAAISVCP